MPAPYTAARFIHLTWVVLAVATGCQRLPDWKFATLPLADDQTAEHPKTPGDFQVNVDGASLTFHAPQVAASKARAFLPRLEELLKANEQAGARQLVYRQPDLALDALRSGITNTAQAESLRFLAAAYDQWLHVPAAAGWSSVYATEGGTRVADYTATRQQLLQEIQQGPPSAKLVQKLVQQAEATRIDTLKLDAYRTAAIAQLVSLQPEQAAASLDAGCRLAAAVDRYQECQLQLLQSDALRRAGKFEQADQAWSQSVTNAAKLTSMQPPLFDPGAWDAASYLRPVKTDWPVAAVQSLMPLSPIPNTPRDQAAAGQSPADREAIVWSVIGQGLLDRGDHEPALVALKRAETMTQNSNVQAWIRISEANALARVGQVSAATAVLAATVSENDKRLASAAAACLGSIKCQAGDPDTGYRLLKKGLDTNALEGWIGLADAEADFGLACLIRGDEKTGLSWLHSAQARYEAQDELARLTQCLTNEREYWKVRKQNDQVTSLEARLGELQR